MILGINFIVCITGFLLGFLPYFYDYKPFQIIYSCIVCFYSLIYLSLMYALYVSDNEEVVISILKIDMPSKLFTYFYVILLSGIAAFYGHIVVSFTLLFMGFSLINICNFQEFYNETSKKLS